MIADYDIKDLSEVRGMKPKQRSNPASSSGSESSIAAATAVAGWRRRRGGGRRGEDGSFASDDGEDELRQQRGLGAAPL